MKSSYLFAFIGFVGLFVTLFAVAINNTIEKKPIPVYYYPDTLRPYIDSTDMKLKFK